MGRRNLPSLPALALTVGFAILRLALAQNSPDDYLRAHNAARAQVGVEPLTWDDGLASYAQTYAETRVDDCRLVHSGGPYGENIFWGWGRPYTAYDAVESWLSERHFYDYNSNSCAPGRLCGHYTQLVWHDTRRVGCARVQCNGHAYFIICSYDPPGNWIGERPYPASA